MAPVPAWTREWRPLVTQLCAHVRDSRPPDEEAQTSLSSETLLLRADRVVGQLYAHRFVDTLPQDVEAQTHALATKFRVHSLEDRAEKLLRLATRCDAQVLKLLLELATSPTTAADHEVALDPLDSSSRWKTALQQEQLQQKQRQTMQDQLVDELFQISTNDEWYQPWEDSDEDDSDWDMSSSDERDAGTHRRVDTRPRNAKRSNEVLEDGAGGSHRQQLATSPEQVARRQETERKRVEGAEQAVEQDELVCRYYPEVISVLGDAEDDDVEDPTCVLEMRTLVPFTLQRPWLLCEAVVKSTAATEDAIPRRLIHEATVVSMVFEALDGVDSFLFECRPVRPAPSIFSVDFQTKLVERSRRSQSVAIGHLSPLTLQHMLDDFAQAGTELQLLRDLLGFIRRARDLSEQHRCVTLEGLASAVSEVVGSLNDSIRSVEEQTNTARGLQEETTSPWSGINARQPTLLGIYGGLKDIFRMISWLKAVLVECFEGLSDRHWHEVKRAERAKCVLDSLYHLMEVEYVEGVVADEDARAAGSLSRSDILLHLFVGALSPYLDLINRMVFERGHFATIPLDGELFFATPASMSVGTSPMVERNQSFRVGLTSLAPFEVNRSLVPAFLESMIEFMNEALASRQMKNRFLQQQQHIAPLRVLFSASIMQTYSRLGVFLVQVKAVESALIKFKSTLRHRRSYSFIEEDMRQLLIQIADMLHYTKSLLSYLTSQISSEGWSKYQRILQSSRSLAEMDATHEQYLDHLLNRFFLLDKHATVVQYILVTFNHILRFVGQADEFVSAVDRNMHKYFPDCWSEAEDEDSDSDQVAKKGDQRVSSVRLLEHPDFGILQSDMARSSKEFKRQSHFLVVVLTAMQKHGASPHVNEIVTQLNYNYFYHQQEHRPRTQPQVQLPRPVKQAKEAPPLNRSGSLRPPPAPKKFSRTRSVHLP
ncbi:hypothetical protein PHYPSEUDO_008631 [Phytophthora pseudosyringae]|uniref:Gamma tubulin complex component C-terminal domain-containing protein n=1 Tax=Phytophthora pseudosyringae TaxID=221518 RepID=A0A8T1W9G5_9STRA|nr:hypothetical protein PHYPSEUDO_008631 [Phytophthora pseudosyringae]